MKIETYSFEKIIAAVLKVHNANVCSRIKIRKHVSDTVDGRSPTDETHDRWKPMSYKVKLFRQKLPAPEAKQIKCEQTKLQVAHWRRKTLPPDAAGTRG